MISKEALEILLAGYYNNANYQEVIEAREKLEKDLDKLEEYKSIEEEIGIDLFTLFKALKDRQVIFKHIYGLKKPKIYLETHKIAGLLFDGKNYGLWLYDNGYGDEFCAYTKDYGKTWALTKEELEQ